MKLNKFISIFILLTTISFTTEARPVLKNMPSKKMLEKLYYKQLKKFSKHLCSNGEEAYFEKLYKEFRGRGDYVPTNGNVIDKKAIRKNLPFLKDKLSWIEHNISKLEKLRNFTQVKQDLSNVKVSLHELLDYKKKYFFSKNKNEKEEIKRLSRKKVREFKKEYSSFLESIFFLKTFHFPVDFYKLRKMYDAAKGNGKYGRNQLYLFRKIVEDGAQNSDHKKSDRFLRTALSSVYLSLMSHHTIISEDLRYDLATTLNRIEKHLNGGVANQLIRQKEWRARTIDEIKFYKKILHLSKKGQASFLTRKKTGRKRLEKYVKRKQEKVYNFWKKRPDYLQAIYALETILMNEVGDVDGEEGLERKDVAQVVINRWHKHWYGYLGVKDFLFDVQTNKKTRKALAKYRWLNVLFKKGEFSFTYYFIHSNLRIFCTDMSSRVKKLRKQNVKISINALFKDRSSTFKAERYFSRASMVGRVDMTNIWSNFSPYPERAGTKIKNIESVKKAYNSDQFEYYYFFKDPWGRFYKVVEINGKVFAVSFSGKEFYSYRNRHYFKYFIPLK